MVKLPTEQPQQTHADPTHALNRLSAREREVMLLVVEGLSNKKIACQLNMSESTVKVHLHSIYRKLAINNRTMLAVLVTQRRDCQVAGRKAAVHQGTDSTPLPAGLLKVGYFSQGTLGFEAEMRGSGAVVCDAG